MNNSDNAGGDDLTLPEADQNTVRPINAGNNSTLQATEGTPCPVTSFRAQAQQTGSNPAVTVRTQCRHGVRYHDFMGLQDLPLLHECFVCQRRFPSVQALGGHMKQHRDRGWKGLYPLNASGSSIGPPFFYVPGFCPPPSAESSVSTVAKRGRGTDARERERTVPAL